MNFRDLLDLGSDDILDVTEKNKIERRKKELGESLGEDFYFKDFSEDTVLFEDFDDPEEPENSEDFKDFEDSEDSEDSQNLERAETKKIEAQKTGFDLLKYGLPIVNARHGFSYNTYYRIPFERYHEVFGRSFTFHMYLQRSVGAWAGNCFGMAAASILTYLKKINLGEYQEPGVPLAETAYDHIVSENFGTYCCLDRTSEFTKLIERYYILQFSQQVVALRQKATPIMEREPARIQRFFHDIYQKRIPYMLTACWNTGRRMAGHAMAVDSMRDPEVLGNGWHRIYLYDPNNPYHIFSEKDSEEEPVYYYKQAQNRYIDVNVVTGDWHMNAVVNAEGGSDSRSDVIGSDTRKKNAFISFLNCETFPSDFTEKASMYPSFLNAAKTLQYSTDSMEVYNLKGNLLCTVANGVMTNCEDERISHLPVIGTFANGMEEFQQEDCNPDTVYGKESWREDSPESCGSLVLPEEPVIIKAGKGFMGMFSADTYTGCVSEDAVTVCFGEEGSMEISADSPTMVNVVVKTGEAEHFVSYMTDIQVSEEPCKIALEGMSLSVEADNRQKMDVSIITEIGISEEREVSVTGGALIKGKDRSREYSLFEQSETLEPAEKLLCSRVLERYQKRDRKLSK